MNPLWAILGVLCIMAGTQIVVSVQVYVTFLRLLHAQTTLTQRFGDQIVEMKTTGMPLPTTWTPEPSVIEDVDYERPVGHQVE